MSSPIFKQASKTDKDAWIRLRETLYDGVESTFHEEEIEIILNDKTKATFLVFETGKEDSIGMLELSLRNIVDGCLSSPVGYIEGIYLHEKVRGKGYGRQMIDFAKKWAKSQGCSELGCDAELDDLSAQMFHQKMGFRETYRIVQYKMDI
ncbi:MAG: GNAT family N-acetyltransferase [Bacteroidetes bacterium]|jgi:aminoglycoside 6'-N-acetyltransferase I|nr:GNAT family N-acetyltransferase [Bacteroidota bacterium]MDF1865961.1 GNAT family N-acetyltransferase [Saprospiraceae bacterium]